jgi:flagellar biosynthesis GTPase FlhF
LRGAQRVIVASGRGGGGAFAFTWHFASFFRHFLFSKRWNWLDVGRQQAAQKRAAQVAAEGDAEEEEEEEEAEEEEEEKEEEEKEEEEEEEEAAVCLPGPGGLC